MAAFTTPHDADQEVRALSFILSALESSRVISFDSPFEHNRARKAKPLQKVAKCLVRNTLDNVAVGALVRGDKYCVISLDDDVCGSINSEREDKTKTEISFEREDIFERTWSNDDVVLFLLNYANHKSAVLSFRSHAYLVQKLWQQTRQEHETRYIFGLYMLVMAYDKNQARYSHAAKALDIQVPADISDISFKIGKPVKISETWRSHPSFSEKVATDIQNGEFTKHVYEFVVAFITDTLEAARENLEALPKALEDSSQDNTTPSILTTSLSSILTTSISETQRKTLDKIIDTTVSQWEYHGCMMTLKPFLPCFEEALDKYNEIWEREPEKYTRLDQDSKTPFTYGEALIDLLKEPLIHTKAINNLVSFARKRQMTPLTDLFTGKGKSEINIVVHSRPRDRTMANVKKALEGAFAGKDKKSQEILGQVTELVTSLQQGFAKLNSNRNPSQNEWTSLHEFTGSVHCESIVAVDIIEHVKNGNTKVLPLLGVSRGCCFVCAQFLHEIYSHYIPGFNGKIVGARETNRVWPVSLPEKTDVFVANKVVDQLRNLLYRKLVEQENRIQKLYNQLKYSKRRMSSGESIYGESSSSVFSGFSEDLELENQKLDRRADYLSDYLNQWLARLDGAS